MNRLLLALTLGLPLAACGGGTGSDAGPGAADLRMAYTPPPISVTVGGMAGDADESCLGARKDPPGPTMDTVITAKITDFQDSNVVVGATIQVWKNAADVPDPKKAIATSDMPSDKTGTYTIKIPAGTPYRVIMGNSGGMAISNGNPVDTISTYEFNRNFDDKSRVAVKVSTREAIPGLVSVIPDPTLGVLAGSVHDCKNTEVGGATIKVSGTATAYDSDSLTFYFVKVGGSTLPTRTQHWTSPDNGTFAALNVPPGLATVTASGIVGSGAPKTLTSSTVPVLAGAITIVELLPATM